MTSRLVIWTARASFVLIFVGLAYLALTHGKYSRLLLFYVPWDKAVHFIAYFALGTIGLVAFPNLKKRYLLFGLFFQSIVFEFIQPFFSRETSLEDIVANGLALIAIGAAMAALKIRGVIKSDH